MNLDEWEKFLSEFGSGDPLNKQIEQEMYEEILEESMNETYDKIKDLGYDGWKKMTNFELSNQKVIGIETKQKTSIVKEMIDYFSKREEYEKCTFLQKCIK